MSLRTDKVQLEIIIKGDKTRQELSQLETKSKQLARELKKLPESSKEFVEKSAEYKKVQARMDELKKSIGLTGLTMRELRDKQRELNMVMSRMDPRLPEYKKLQAESLQVKNRLRELSGQAQATGSSLSKMAGGFNKYFTMFAAFSASIAGVVFSVRKMVDAFSTFQDSVSNLSALTFLKGDDMKWLADKAKELSVSVTDSGVKITSSAEDIVNAFSKMGSARPELLQNKEALAMVTEQALILAEAGNIELDEAIAAVAASMNQFNLAADQSARVINVLGAGSLEGSAEISDLTGSLKNVGTVADDANLSLEETVAVLEVLGERQLKGEEAGTMLRGSLIKLKQAGVGYQSGMFNLNDALIEVNKMLSATSSEMERDAILIDMFGIRNITVGNILLQNVDKFNSLTQSVTGTSVAVEQAVINTDNHASSMEQARNKAKIMSIEIGEKLAPAMMFSTNAARKFILALFELPKIVRQNSSLFIALGAVLIAYNAAKLKTIGTMILMNLRMKQGIGLKLLEWAQYQKLLFQENLASLSKLRLAASTNILAQSYIRLRAIIMMNPIGAIVVAIGALAIAINEISKSINRTSVEQQTLNEINKRSYEIAAEERAQLFSLSKQLRATNEGSEERSRLLTEINDKYGQYLPKLLSEKSSYDEIKNSLFLINIELLKKAKLQAVSDKLVENEKILLDLRDKQTAAIKEQENTSRFRQKERQFLQFVIDDTQQQIELINKQNNALVDVQKNISAVGAAVPKPSPATVMAEDFEVVSEAVSDAGKSVDKYVNKYLDAEVELYLSYLRDVENLRGALNLKQISQQEYYDNLLILNSRYRAKIAEQTEKDPDLVIPDITKPSGSLSQEEAMKQHDEQLKIFSAEKKERLDRINAIVNAEKKSYSDKLNALKVNLDNGLILEEEYNQAVEELKLEHYRRLSDLATAYAKEVGLELLNTISMFEEARFTSDMAKIKTKYDTEEQRLDQLYARKGISEVEYEKQKTELNKKRLAEERTMKKKHIEFDAKAKEASVAMQSAASIFELSAILAGYIASGNVPMAILAGAQIALVAASTVAQISMINASKDAAIAELAKGKYPLRGQSGQIYDVVYGGKARTGLVNQPTHFIAGEKGAEMVIDYPTLKNISLNAPEVLSTIMSMRVPQFAAGNYPSPESSSTARRSGTTSPSVSDAAFAQMISLLQNIDSKLANTYSFKDLYDKLDEVDQAYQKIERNFKG